MQVVDADVLVDPGGHGSHVCVVTLENCPARHTLHVVALTPETLPGKHDWHDGLPEAEANVPGLHSTQERASGEMAVPGLHGLASVRSELMMKPGGADWHEAAPFVEE